MIAAALALPRNWHSCNWPSLATHCSTAPWLQDVQQLIGDEDLEEPQLAEKLSAEVAQHVMRRAANDIRQRVPVCREVLLPVEMSDKQADCYKTVLARWADWPGLPPCMPAGRHLPGACQH